MSEKTQAEKAIEAAEAINSRLKEIETDTGLKADQSIVDALKLRVDELVESGAKKEAVDLEIKLLTDLVSDTQKQIKGMIPTSQNSSFGAQVKSFIEKNGEKIANIHKAGNGRINFDIKAVGNVTTANATLPVAAPALQGTQAAPPSNANLRGVFIDSLVSMENVSVASVPYTDTIPGEGEYLKVAEGAAKPQIDFDIETRYASPIKCAAWIRLTDEAVQDIPRMQSIATDYLFKKHALKRQNIALFDATYGATVYGRVFSAGGMATAVATPNFLDVVNAAITDIYTTQNYTDEMAYMPSVVMISPTDYFLEFVSAKDGDGKPLYGTASLFDSVRIGGVTIMPERTIPSGKIFVADMSKYNMTNYIPYSVSIGWIDDDFIKNQFVMLGESRFHAYVKELDKQAFLYDDIATIRTAITAV